jgi:hypothetical protein
MPDTAIDPVPKQGKFRRALAAVGAWLRALDYTGFDYTLNRIEGLEQELAKGRVAPKPGGEFQRWSPRWRRQPRTLTTASSAVVI